MALLRRSRFDEVRTCMNKYYIFIVNATSELLCDIQTLFLQ